MKDTKILLKVLVGSHAHDLAGPTSDKDYRAVYILPTSNILSLGFRYKGNDWIEGDEDNTAYELGHFLHLALKCNPTILECFKAPIIECNEDGRALINLFQYVWNPQDAYNAFVGYGLNQRKKFLDKKDNRQDKYACAYIRTLYNLSELLMEGTFSVKIENKTMNEQLRRYKSGKYTMGEVIDDAEFWTNQCKNYLPGCHNVPSIDKINEFLLEMRQKYWRIA